FQLVRARARGYRNVDTFIAMIYLVGAPLPKLVNSI
ncbi:transposase, partial [Vineibacter terrae]